jgi:ACS family glucarate transporter-like MFS transporter
MMSPWASPPGGPYAAPSAGGSAGPSNVRLWVVLVATLSAVLLYLDRVCISVVGPEIQDDLGISSTQLGWVYSAFFWSYALAQVPSGWLSDRFGARGMMVLYVAGWSALTALTGLAGGFAALMGLRLGFGVAQAGAYPTCSAMLSRWVPLSSRGLASSVVALGGRVGGAIAPYLTTSLMIAVAPVAAISLSPWRTVMLVYGCVGLAVAALVWSVFRERPGEHPACNPAEQDLIAQGRPEGERRSPAAPAGQTWLLLKRLTSNRSMWLMCLSQWGTNIGWAFLVTWLPTYMKDVQQVSDLGQRGLLSSIPLFVGMAGLVWGGHITDWATRQVGLRWGRRLPLAASRFMAAGVYVAFLGVDSALAACAAFALIAFFTDLGVGATWAFTQDVGGRHVGSVLGWGNMWGNFGAAMSPLILGWVHSHLDANGDWHEAFIVCAACFFISGVASLGIDAAQPIDPQRGPDSAGAETGDEAAS